LRNFSLALPSGLRSVAVSRFAYISLTPSRHRKKIRDPRNLAASQRLLRQSTTFGGNNMTRSLLVLAASLLVAPAAWAMDAPIQPGGGNNVNAQFATPAPAPAPAPSSISHAQDMPTFTPSAYGSASECMTAAASAHASLDQCEGLKK
jgi:hypothetical protein